MEYAYATCILNETGEEINEENLTAVLEAAGCSVIESRVKAIVAALEDVDVGAVTAVDVENAGNASPMELEMPSTADGDVTADEDVTANEDDTGTTPGIESAMDESVMDESAMEAETEIVSGERETELASDERTGETHEAASETTDGDDGRVTDAVDDAMNAEPPEEAMNAEPPGEETSADPSEER